MLDLAHLRVTADHLGVDARAFARSLPLHAVRELHVCGPVLVESVGLRDDHQELSEEDYILLEWTLERTNAEVLTLEYPKTRTVRCTFEEQAEALERQLDRLGAMTGTALQVALTTVQYVQQLQFDVTLFAVRVLI